MIAERIRPGWNEYCNRLFILHDTRTARRSRGAAVWKMKNHAVWIMLLLDAYALACIYVFLMLFSDTSTPALNMVRG